MQGLVLFAIFELEKIEKIKICIVNLNIKFFLHQFKRIFITIYL